MMLSRREARTRDILIRVAQGKARTHKPGLISYKELWTRISREPWGRGRRSEIVNLIVRIAAHDLKKGLPPLNEIVVTKKDGVPGSDWDEIKPHLEENSSVSVPYKTHREAQEACWRYWGRKINGSAISNAQAEEGYSKNQTGTVKTRNAELIKKRKILDNYTCQVCNLR